MVIPPKIGVLDSGIGGLSVLREIHRLLPDHPTLYFADQLHLPYGSRPTAEIRVFCEAITDFLLERGAAVIVVACNTASAASLLYLREKYPHAPIVGMEPAVKPAAEHSRSGVVGVLSTRTTAEGSLYQRVLQRYASGVRVLTQIAPELVRIAEEQSQHTAESRAIIAGYIRPLVEAGADEIVLACTHFPFLADAIQETAGARVRLIDPSPAIARQVARVWPVDLPVDTGPHQYFTSGSVEGLQSALKALVNVDAHVQGAAWRGDDSLLVFHSEIEPPSQREHRES
jgi:glutamate racemase